MEPNPDFLTDIKAAAGGKGVILACEAGGSTKPTPSFQFGKSSRSLSAAYRCPLPIIRERVSRQVSYVSLPGYSSMPAKHRRALFSLNEKRANHRGMILEAAAAGMSFRILA